jgi:trimethylamine---corrinoid protein Co-methyltransferase
MLIAKGCLETDSRIHYPQEVVQKALKTVPRQITFYTQDGARAFSTADATPRFGTAVNCVQVLDPKTDAYRPCLLSDIRDHGRVQDALPHIDIAASLGYPSDIAAEDESLLSVRALLETTRKPIFFTGHDEHIVRRIWQDMAASVGGMATLAAKPVGLDLIGPISPLKLGGETCQRLIMAARLMLPVVCYPAIFPGMACPLTLAGAITQAAAESLAGMVISQIAQPGAPVMSGASVMPMDMRRADMAIGSPEYTLAGLGAADFFNHIGVPNWVGSGCSDAHDIGPQAFAEAAAGLQATCMAPTALTHNLGVLSSGRTGSVEMLIACDELAAMSTKFAAGIDVTNETIAVDVIRRAAPDNTFLTDPHTLARYETEMWMPNLFQRNSLENWQEEGQAHIRTRLKDRLSDILRGT